MQITISKLPKDIQSKIPVSIRASSDVWELEKLPKDVQYLVYQYVTAKPKQVQYEQKYDARPIESAYNDVEMLDLINTIIDYFSNMLLVHTGVYPFDVNFGCRLKEYLQTKDTELRKLYIQNELQTICDTLTNDYNVPIKILSAKVTKIPSLANEAYVYDQYFLTIDLQVDGKNVQISV